MKLLDVLTAPWAILPDKKVEIDGIYATHLRGEKIDIKAIEAALGRTLNSEQKPYDVQNGVAIISLDGVLAKRMNLFTQISGGTSTQIVGQQLRQAMQDPNVSAILFHVDSPGGSVDGTQELADAIFAARDQKPMVSFADGTMASAAYWIGSATSGVYAGSDTTLIGSIGVLATHVDYSGYESKVGIKTTEITAGKYKRIASEYAPLSPEGRQSMQDQVDYLYSVFLDAVAQNRGVESTDAVHESMADGRLFFGKQAIQVGLVDGVATMDQLIAQLAAGEIGTSTSNGARMVVTVPRAIASPTTAGAAVASTLHHQEIPMAEKPAITVDDAKPFVDAAIAAARTEFESKIPTFKKEGADAERTRIQAVFEQSMPGHEKLVQTLAFDGTTTGPEAAVQILNAERQKVAAMRTNLTSDAPKPAPAAIPPEEKKEGEQVQEDPHAVAQKARQYQAEQQKLGHRVSTAEAVAHVTKTEK